MNELYKTKQMEYETKQQQKKQTIDLHRVMRKAVRAQMTLKGIMLVIIVTVH